jgi:hypothetical protein
MALPAAFAFDVFGTVVDWRTSIARESAPFLREIGRADAHCLWHRPRRRSMKSG